MSAALKKYALLIEAIQDKVDDLYDFVVSDHHSTMCGKDLDLDLRENLAEIKAVKKELGILACAINRRAYRLSSPVSLQ